VSLRGFYGYILLGAIIERVTGKDYNAYFEEHILRPAGMLSPGPAFLARRCERDTRKAYAAKISRLPIACGDHLPPRN
jgi:CubicO group peptidase (beta-lactamase class C family)